MEDFRIVYADLPTTITGFARKKDGFVTIVLNSRASAERQRACVYHELLHIQHDDFAPGDADRIEALRHKESRP